MSMEKISEHCEIYSVICNKLLFLQSKLLSLRMRNTPVLERINGFVRKKTSM